MQKKYMKMLISSKLNLQDKDLNSKQPILDPAKLKPDKQIALQAMINPVHTKNSTVLDDLEEKSIIISEYENSYLSSKHLQTHSRNSLSSKTFTSYHPGVYSNGGTGSGSYGNLPRASSLSNHIK